MISQLTAGKVLVGEAPEGTRAQGLAGPLVADDVTQTYNVEIAEDEGGGG